MKAFLSATAFVLVVMGITAAAFEMLTLTATEAYSTSSVRVGHENPVDGRLGWSPDVEAQEDH